MYSWIWRHLPFGLPGKLSGSVLLVAATAAILWYGVFPAAEHLLPFGDVQVTDGGGSGTPAGAGPSTPSSTRPSSLSPSQLSPRPSR